MIISRTPLRISFVGGGSDIATYYKKRPGAVVSTAINKYIYITVNDNFDDNIRAKYSLTEVVQNTHDLKHPLIRECLKLVGIKNNIEITSLADIPSRGTGLGSSSSFTVGLLNALYAYKGIKATPETLAKNACKIEIDILKNPVGKQDQYIAAFGGFNYFNFLSNGKVKRTQLTNNKILRQVEKKLILLYTGKVRKASQILAKQSESIEKDSLKTESITEMVSLADLLAKDIKNSNIKNFGEILEKNWLLKKGLSKKISSKRINDWYKKAKDNGAEGGKILGAGGGGFLLLYAKPSLHSKIIHSLPSLSVSPFKFEPEGSKIIFTDK